MRQSSLLGLSLALLASRAHAGNVHIVGGVAATQPTIQAAIDAATDGDIVLVRSTPNDGFIVDAKSLTIVGEPAGVQVVGDVVVLNLASNQTCALRGLKIDAFDQYVVEARDCAGHLRLEDLVVHGGPSLSGLGVTGVRLANCLDVSLAHCTVVGGLAPHFGYAGRGLQVESSAVALDASAITGGHGFDGFFVGTVAMSSGPGNAGIELGSGCDLRLQACSVDGGAGGSGTSGYCIPFPVSGGSGSSGGAGISASVATTIPSIDSPVAGGAGGTGGSAPPCGGSAGANGAPGPATSGVSLNVLPGTLRELTVDALAREQGLANLTVVGPPGEVVTLLVSASCQRNVGSGFVGPVLVGPGMRRLPLGSIPPSGVLQTALPVSELGPGVLGIRRFLQVYCRDAALIVRLSNCAVVSWLDSSL